MMNVIWNTNGQFLTRTVLQGQNLPYMGTVGDLSGDGIQDVYLVNDGFDTVHNGLDYNAVYVIDTDRTISFGGNVHFADIDGDRDLDVGVGPIDVLAENCPEDPGDEAEFALLENNGGVLSDPTLIRARCHP